MSEEQQSIETTEEKPVEESTEEKKERKPSTPLLDAAHEAAKRIEEANSRTEELLGRMEQVHERMMLSGKADASISQPQKKEPSDEEYAKDFMEGKIGFSK